MAEIRPQAGYQMNVLTSPADILISGASAGVGKTFALILEPLRHVNTKGFNFMFFRRTTPQIRNPWGLWDTSKSVYLAVKARPKESELEWIFKSGVVGKMSHLEHENDKYNHQGAQYAMIGFDELTHFSKSQFLYLLSRNRSTCGVRPYVRATCNPDPDSWVAELVAPWIDQNTGFPIPEMEWQLRYMVVDAGNFVFAETKTELIEKCKHLFDALPEGIDGEEIIKSVSFISGKITDNKKLLEADPSYIGNLLSLEEEERSRLLDGNWKVRTDGLGLFPHHKIADMFSLTIKSEEKNKYITSDVARFGRDLAVVYYWENWTIKEVHILTKSKTTEITEIIEKIRREYGVAKSDVLVDQDGVGGGVVDEGGYEWFSGGTPAKNKENYANLKTQCAYRMSERVAKNEVAIDAEIFVNYSQNDDVKVGNVVKTWRKLLSEDLRSFKRRERDNDGKQQIITKTEQKNILGGRSPDSGDAFIMREYFELREKDENNEIFFI